jgi:hypothetical protein
MPLAHNPLNNQTAIDMSWNRERDQCCRNLTAFLLPLVSQPTHVGNSNEGIWYFNVILDIQTALLRPAVSDRKLERTTPNEISGGPGVLDLGGRPWSWTFANARAFGQPQAR